MLVSVIIPNFNRAGLVDLTIENCLRQTVTAKEIIVVDDGSTDNSVEVINRFAKRGVKLLQQPNRGPGAARNHGLTHARGKFIHFMDSDDLCAPNKLEVQIATAEAKQADFVYSPWIKGVITGNSVMFCDHVLQTKALRSQRAVLRYMSEGWSTVLQSALVRTSCLEKIGRYREDITLYEDLDLLMRIACEGGRWAFCPGTLTLYRQNNSDKLTEAVATRRRVVDHMRFLVTMDRLSREHAGRIQKLARFDFASLVAATRRGARELDLEPGEYPDGFEALAVPGWVERHATWYERWRWLRRTWNRVLYGSRWHNQLQARRPGPAVRRLVEDMGLTVTGDR